MQRAAFRTVVASTCAVVLAASASVARAAEVDPLLDWIGASGSVPAHVRGVMVGGQPGVRVIGTGTAAGRGALKGLGAAVRATTASGRTFVADLPLARIANARVLPGIDRLEASVRVEPLLDRSATDMGVPVQRPPYAASALTGRGVVVGIVDTGIDIDHADFKTASGATRVIALWDQKGERTFEGSSVATCGVKDEDGHGTHVAGTAAGTGQATGNGATAYRYVGVAPEADLVVVKTTFFTSDILEGVRWCFEKAGSRPCVVNLSLGGHSGPHDGSSALSAGIDELVAAQSGRVVVVAAGNDYGAKIHARRATGSPASIALAISSYTAQSGARNDSFVVDLYHPKDDRVRVVVTSPRGERSSFEPGTSGERGGNDGAVSCSNARTQTTGSDFAREIVVQIYDADASKPPVAGEWKIALEPVQTTSQSGRVDAWLAQGADKARFADGDDELTVGSPGDARGAITVAAYVTKTTWTTSTGGSSGYGSSFAWGELAPFSSKGPTRDGRSKPDVAAPGAGIAAARSSAASLDASRTVEDGVHAILQGTSMASPHVTGLVALIFQKHGALAHDQVASMIVSSARRTGGDPLRWGAGKVDFAATGATGSPTAPPTSGFRITTTTLADATLGSRYQAKLAATGGTAPFTFRVTAGALPPGLVLASDGTIGGTPLAPGASSFVVSVDDARRQHAEATLSLRVVVSGTQPPSTTTLRVKTTELAHARSGDPYSARIEAEGGTAPYQFSVVGGAFPRGLVLLSSGEVRGTPRVDGSVTVTVRVRDAKGALSDGAVKLVVDRGTKTFVRVETLSLAKRDSWFDWYVRATLRVTDESGRGVPNVTVQVRFSGAVSGTRTGTTDSNGNVKLDSPKGGWGSYTATVVSISGATVFTDEGDWKVRSRTLAIEKSFGNWLSLIF